MAMPRCTGAFGRMGIISTVSPAWTIEEEQCRKEKKQTEGSVVVQFIFFHNVYVSHYQHIQVVPIFTVALFANYIWFPESLFYNTWMCVCVRSPLTFNRLLMSLTPVRADELQLLSYNHARSRTEHDIIFFFSLAFAT